MMLPCIPTLLLNPGPQIRSRLLLLFDEVQSSKECKNAKTLFLENFIHCSKNQLIKFKAKNNNKSKKIEHYENNEMKKKIFQSQAKQIRQQIFLRNIIEKGKKWPQVLSQLGITTKLKRSHWHYPYYLTLQILRRTPGTFGQFVCIRLFGRSWSVVEQMFQLMKKSVYMKHKVDTLIKKGPAVLQQVYNSLERNLLISLALQQDIPAILKRINFEYLQETKDLNGDFFVDEWMAFLCNKFVSNQFKEIPFLKFSKEQHNFILKWARNRKITNYLKKQFQAKLINIVNNVKNYQEAFINEIQECLLKGLLEDKSWSIIKEEIILLVQLMNATEGKDNVYHSKSLRFNNESDIDFDRNYSEGSNSASVVEDGRLKYSFYTQLSQQISAKNQPNIQDYKNKSKDISFIQQNIALNSQQEQILFFINKLLEEIEAIQKKHFQGVSHEALVYHCRKQSLKMEAKFHSIYQLFSRSQEVRNRIKNQELRKIVRALSIFTAEHPQTAVSISEKKVNISQDINTQSTQSSRHRATEQNPRLTQTNQMFILLQNINKQYRSQRDTQYQRNLNK